MSIMYDKPMTEIKVGQKVIWSGWVEWGDSPDDFVTVITLDLYNNKIWTSSHYDEPTSWNWQEPDGHWILIEDVFEPLDLPEELID